MNHGAAVARSLAADIDKQWRSVLDIEDVMQVTYMEAILQIRQFSRGGVDGFRAWLTRLAENNLIDAVRGLEAAKQRTPSAATSSKRGR